MNSPEIMTKDKLLMITIWCETHDLLLFLPLLPQRYAKQWRQRSVFLLLSVNKIQRMGGQKKETTG